MKKYIITFILVISLLYACSCQVADDPQLAVNESIVYCPVQTPAPSLEPTPTPIQDTPTPSPNITSTVRISNVLEDGYAVISKNRTYWLDEEPAYLYLYTDNPIYHVLISGVYEYIEGDASTFREESSSLYVAELSAAQTLQLADPYPIYYGDTEIHYYKLAYTNSNGSYETFLVNGDKEENNPSLLPIEPELEGKIYHSYYFPVNESDAFYKKMMAGTFDDYIPTGFRITKGSLSDVNNDGIEDAVICLTTDAPHLDAFGGVMPLFILIGQPDGGYNLEKINTDALYIPYRSSSHAVAGNGYIDMIYDEVDGAACHHQQVYRFWFDSETNDWLLKEISHQPSYTLDYVEELPPAFVNALPDFADLPIEDFSRETFYYSAPDWDSFDAVAEIAVPLWDEHSVVYTLAINLNDTAGTYEGYIHKHYESYDSGGFIHTISGMYDGNELSVIANKENMSFIVQNDIWLMDEHDEDAFHLMTHLSNK